MCHVRLRSMARRTCVSMTAGLCLYQCRESHVPHASRGEQNRGNQTMKRRSLLQSTAALATLVSPHARAQEPKKIALWHIYARDFDMIHLGIKLFNQANNGYVIEPRLIPYVQINPELIRAIATDSPPDLVVINDPDIASYASQGQFLDLTGRVANSKRIGAASFYKGPNTSDHWRGRRYAVAREMNAISLYINDDMF